MVSLFATDGLGAILLVDKTWRDETSMWQKVKGVKKYLGCVRTFYAINAKTGKYFAKVVEGHSGSELIRRTDGVGYLCDDDLLWDNARYVTAAKKVIGGKK